MHEKPPSYLRRKSGRIAYHTMKGKNPGVLFLGGFRSDMTGVKALALEQWCRDQGRAFTRFDYTGHGQSQGAFEDCTIGQWKNDALAVLDEVTRGKQVLVGSSMGGWLALLLARQKPRRVAGIVGIAAAPDFTEYLIWEKLALEQKTSLQKEGKVMVPSEYGEPYPITQQFITEGRQHLLLHQTIEVTCPVRLLHGMQDIDVPWETALSINEKLLSQDVKTILIEDGDHRLSEPEHIEKILKVCTKLLDTIRT